MEIVECVFKVSVKIYATVDEVQANKKRCQRLAERIRCLVTPLNTLMEQHDNSAVYKEALIDLARTLEEARQFLNTFIKTKSVLRRLQNVYYANKVKEKFVELNERLNSLVPALTFGLQVECRRSVQNKFSIRTRWTEDTRDESGDLKDIQKMVNALGLPTFHCIRSSELKEKKNLAESTLYSIYLAKYRLNPVVLKKPKFGLTSMRKDLFLSDAKNMLQFNSANVVRVYGICVELKDSCIIVMEYMKLGSLYRVLSSSQSLSRATLLRMMVETARGLYFVHCCEYIHGNLSSSKYLVDEDFHTKIAGFEFSGTKSFSLTSGRKQPCCVPPECREEQQYTEKSDVYNYGLVLSELLTRLSTKLPLSESGCRHCQLLEELNDEADALEVSRACLENDVMLRPSMEEVVTRLTALLDIPGKSAG